MRTLRTVVIVSVVVGSLALAPAAMAAGKAPMGKGLPWLTADYHFSNLGCDNGIDDFLVAGNSGWTVDPDSHYVLAGVAGALTATFPDSTTMNYEFSQSFGNKSGKTESISCTADFEHTHDGVHEVGVMTFDLVKIW